MKKHLLFFLLFPILAMCQNPVVGKKFEAEVHASCAETTTGGGMSYGYCVLTFDQQKVTVSSYTKSFQDGYLRHDGTETKQYSYTVKGKAIQIKGFVYGNLEIADFGELIATQEKNPKQHKDFIFEQIE